MGSLVPRIFLALALVLVAHRGGDSYPLQEVGASIPAATEQAAAFAGLRLYVADLPAGNVPGFSIDFPNWSGHPAARKFSSSSWLRDFDGDGVRDYDGLLLRGRGIDVTNIVPGSADATILIERHPGVVVIQDATIHCGKSQGIFFGLEHRGMAVMPQFKLVLLRCRVVADPPSSTGTPAKSPAASSRPTEAVSPVQTTTKWGLFVYQGDLVARGCTFDLRFSAEHVLYMHGFAHDGLEWTHNVVQASGAEQVKLTARPWEAQWVPTARATITGSTFGDWYQSWSWRGGGGIVVQGAGIPVTVTGCTFKNTGCAGAIAASSRSRCVMVDDGGDNDRDGVNDFYSYAALGDVPAGTPGQGFANGPISISDCVMYAGPGSENLSILVRIGKNGGGSWFAAPSFSLTDSALYGERLQLQLGGVPAGGISVSGCNTDTLRARAIALGMDVSSQAKIPLGSRVIDAGAGFRQ